MSTKSPRLLAATVIAALSLVAAACSSGGAISDLASDQLPETADVEETTDAEADADEAEVLGETEELDEEPADEDEPVEEEADEEEVVEDEELAEDSDATADDGDSLDDLIDDAGLSEEDSLTLGTDLGEPEDGEDADDADTDADGADADGETEDTEPTVPTRFAITGVDVGLNLRAGAGASFDVVAGIERDRVLTATGNVQDGWTEVQIDGLTGWVLGEFLVETEAVDTPPVAAPATTVAPAPSTTVAPAPTSFTVANVDAGVNLRGGPSADSAIVGGAALGETVTATGNVSGAWTEVTFNGTTGWAISSALQAN